MYKELVSKIYFPRIFMPMGVIGAGFVDLGISIVILLVVVLVYGIVPSAAILFLPFLVVLAAAALLGATALLSAINVRYRDVRYVVPFAVQMWLFVTPVVYSGTTRSASPGGRSRRSTRWRAWSKAFAGPCSTPAAPPGR